MRDRAWAEMALAEAGITPERVGDLEFEVAVRETLDREAGLPPRPNSPISHANSVAKSKSESASPFAELLTPDRLRQWQERNRQQASPVELAEAERLAAAPIHCPTCDGARFVRDPAFRPGAQLTPMHASSVATFPGAMPCPDCVVGAAVEWLLERSNVPTVLRGLSFDDFEPLAGKARSRGRVRAWANDVTSGARVAGNLLLHGAPGRGKTHLAIAAVLECCRAGVRAEFWPYQDVLREMQLRFGAEDDSAQRWEARIRDIPVLVVDDVGAEHSHSQWAIEVLEALIDHRLARALPTLLTTNLSPAELAGRLGQRAASRLHLYAIDHVEGVDMRAVLGRQLAEAVS